MSNTSTPIKSVSKKRELSSPEDLNELKKNKSEESEERQESDQLSGSYLEQSESDISDLSEMATNMADGEKPDSEGTSSGTSITLKENDLKTIAQFLKDAFDPKLSEMVKSIVTGVLEGLQTKVTTLETENKDLRERVEKLEAKADAAEQNSRRNCLRIAGVSEEEAADTDAYVLDL